MNHLEWFLVGLNEKAFAEDVSVETFAAEYHSQHLSFNIRISLLTIAQCIRCECDWLAIL